MFINGQMIRIYNAYLFPGTITAIDKIQEKPLRMACLFIEIGVPKSKSNKSL